MRIQQVLVVIPARDEAARVGRCLDAVCSAREALARAGVESRCVLVADACVDATVAIARRHADVDVLEVDLARVGAVRHAGVVALGGDAASAHPASAAATWVASTDADSVVPVDWLTTHVRLADEGADAVTGLVVPDADDTDPAILERWSAAHPHRASPERIHGANLGVRLDAYLEVGGFPDLAAHEDVGLVGALRATGRRVMATADGTVLTSGRSLGRTPEGFAEHLRALAP